MFEFLRKWLVNPVKEELTSDIIEKPFQKEPEVASTIFEAPLKIVVNSLNPLHYEEMQRFFMDNLRFSINQADETKDFTIGLLVINWDGLKVVTEEENEI